MRKKVHLSTGTKNNTVADRWGELLVQHIIIQQLDIPYRLKAKLLHQSSSKETNGGE
ncbi:hypothetical protein [Priestia koreensis]|uniref:hypothetical protein n=1 Tax=Priestia koreensis TaxID=284581 RepID=UPI00203FB42B|nr:hypothetical protein [Priestia koreensis]MCM3004939.1 hypothetical protein [Priestia koreensis]